MEGHLQYEAVNAPGSSAEGSSQDHMFPTAEFESQLQKLKHGESTSTFMSHLFMAARSLPRKQPGETACVLAQLASLVFFPISVDADAVSANQWAQWIDSLERNVQEWGKPSPPSAATARVQLVSALSLGKKRKHRPSSPRPAETSPKPHTSGATRRHRPARDDGSGPNNEEPREALIHDPPPAADKNGQIDEATSITDDGGSPSDEKGNGPLVQEVVVDCTLPRIPSAQDQAPTVEEERVGRKKTAPLLRRPRQRLYQQQHDTHSSDGQQRVAVESDNPDDTKDDENDHQGDRPADKRQQSLSQELTGGYMQDLRTKLIKILPMLQLTKKVNKRSTQYTMDNKAVNSLVHFTIKNGLENAVHHVEEVLKGQEEYISIFRLKESGPGVYGQSEIKDVIHDLVFLCQESDMPFVFKNIQRALVTLRLYDHDYRMANINPDLLGEDGRKKY